ncbi:DDB1- and CUL4-associated factor 11 isoform X3 [Amblyomma americanum]
MSLTGSSWRMCERPPSESASGRNSENPGRYRVVRTDDPNYARVLQFLLRSIEANRARLFSSALEVFYQDDSDDELQLNGLSASSPDNSRILKNDLYTIVNQQSGSKNRGKPEQGTSMASLLQQRECGMPFRGIFTRGDKCRMSSRFLPNVTAGTLFYPSKTFCGTFARNGDIFMTACQDCVIRIYDTSHGDFDELKCVSARDVGWSILDMAVSPDGLYFAYSSWSEYLHLCNVYGDHQVHEALALCPEDRRFCIFSLQFSCDGKDILGGANDSCLYVYDREAHHRSLRIRAHDGDVNAVAFADKTSQILFSGGDDGLCKVWDRRTLSERDPKPVGILAGHCNGITFVDSKNDARYLITNSKDQTIKLWDMRAFSSKEGIQATKMAVACQNWDYRWQRVPKKLLDLCEKLPGDTSLMTYQGHTVLQTLIRCHFSPIATTGQQFIYTGCASGRVVVYNLLTGKIETVLSGHRACVRDVSWHPYLPMLVSSSWDGSVTKWVYNSEPESKPVLKGKLVEEHNE